MKARGPWHDYTRIFHELLRREPQNLPVLAAKLGLCRASYGLGARDFFDFDLRHRALSTWRNYLSDVPHMRRTMRALHPEPFARLANDKVLSTERFLERGVQVAPVLLVAGRELEAHPSAGRIPVVNEKDALTHWLAEEAPDRLFCKPATGTFGNGVFRAHRKTEGWQVDDAIMGSAALAAHLLAQDDSAGVNRPAILTLFGGDRLSKLTP